MAKTGAPGVAAPTKETSPLVLVRYGRAAGRRGRRRLFLPMNLRPAFFFSALCVGLQAAAPVVSVERTDPNSQLAHRQLLEKRKQGRIDVYFLGDSITRRWGATDYPDFLANWNQNFHGWNAGDFGWGGDTTLNMLWRVEHGELDGVDPKVIVLLGGTNDVGKVAGDDAKAEEISRRVEALVSLCLEKAPHATLILHAIFPRNDGAGLPTIRAINARIARLADGKRVRFLDLGDRLADKEGKLLDGVSVDQLHLSVKGYQIWADALKPMLRELLGPPGEKDFAPPPTGDPSAKKK